MKQNGEKLPSCVQKRHINVKKWEKVHLPTGESGYLVLGQRRLCSYISLDYPKKSNGSASVGSTKFLSKTLRSLILNEKRAMSLFHSTYLSFLKPFHLLDVLKTFHRLEESVCDSPNCITMIVNSPDSYSTLGDVSTYHRGLLVYFKGSSTERQKRISELILIELSWKTVRNVKTIIPVISTASLDSDTSRKCPPRFTRIDTRESNSRDFFQWELGPFVPFPEDILNPEKLINIALQNPLNGKKFNVSWKNCQDYAKCLQTDLFGYALSHLKRSKKTLKYWIWFSEWTAKFAQSESVKSLFLQAVDYAKWRHVEGPSKEFLEMVAEQQEEDGGAAGDAESSLDFGFLSMYLFLVNPQFSPQCRHNGVQFGGEGNKGEENERFTLVNYLQRGVALYKNRHPFKATLYGVINSGKAKAGFWQKRRGQ